LALRRNGATVSSMPPEDTPIEQEIRALLDRAEQAGDSVKDLVRVCLSQFRQDCFAALAFYQVGMVGILSSGSQEGLEDLAIERDRAGIIRSERDVVNEAIG
jgi:hypothetical protein